MDKQRDDEPAPLHGVQTDSDGLPLAVHLDGGNRFDSVLTKRTLDAASVQKLPPRPLADKAWDGRVLQQGLKAERGIELISPNKRTSRHFQTDGRKLRRYKRRWKIERLLAWLKRWRRLSTRWEQKAENFVSLVHLGCIVLLPRAVSRL